MIGAAGDTLTVSAGAIAGTQVTILAGALSQPTAITAAPGATIATAGSLAVGPPVRLEPAGLLLSPPATVTLRYSAASIPSGRAATDIVVVRREDASGALSTLAPLSIDPAGETVVVSTGSFSTFQPHVGAGASAALSTVSVSPTAGLRADGVDTATVTIVARDVFGLPLSGAVVSLGATGTGNTIAMLASSTSASGVATGSITSTVAEVKTIVATVTGGGGGLVTLSGQPTVHFQAGPAARLVFRTGPASVPANSTLSPVRVGIEDAAGNLAAGSGGPISLALAPTATATGALAGTLAVVPSGGLSEFADLTVDAAGTGYRLRASTPGLATATSAPFDVTPLAALHLSVRAMPRRVTAGATMSPAIEVATLDAAGQVAVGTALRVTLAIETNPSGAGVLAGTATRTAVAGVARFDDLRIDVASTGYRWRATAPGATGTVSAAFDVASTFFDPGAPLFSAGLITRIGVAPLYGSSGDVDGDGAIDLAVACRLSNLVSVLFGDGRGGLERVDVLVGDSPRDAALADVDGDGFLDMIAANGGEATLSIARRDPTRPRAFLTPTTISTGPSPFSVKALDLDGDGRRDLVVPDEVSNDVRVYIQSASVSGTFLAPVAYPVGAGAGHLAVADANGDGRADLVVPCAGTSSLSILYASAGTPGTFLAAVTVAAASSPVDAAIGDINGDGRADIAAACSGAERVSVLLQDATTPGVFPAPVSVTVVGTPSGVALADLDLDGRLDLIVTVQSNDLWIFLQSPTVRGAFLAPTRVPTPSSPMAPILADLDGDGRVDVIVPHWSTADLDVFLGGAATPSTLHVARAHVLNETPRMHVAKDLDADGLPDLVIANQLGDRVIVIRQDPARPGELLAPTLVATGSTPTMITVHDIDHDGRDDLIIPFGGGPNEVSIVRQVPSPGAPGTFLPKVSYVTGALPIDVSVGDLDGDGREDLLVATPGAHEARVLLQSTTVTGTFALGAAIPMTHTPWYVVAADLNGDGRLDAVGASTDAASISVALQDPIQRGAFLAPVAYATPTRSVSLEAEDLDSDGAIDIVSTNRDQGSISIWWGRGDGTLGLRTDVAVGAPQIRCAHIVDMNGDGVRDVAVARAGEAFGGGLDTGAIHVVLQDPRVPRRFVTGPAYRSAGTSFGGGPHWVDATDFDVDGDLDLVCVHGSSGDKPLTVLLRR